MTINRAWDIIEKVGVCMLTTRRAGGDFHACPVEGRPNRDEACLYVVTDIRSAKEHEIERDPLVGLTFVDQKANAYLALSACGAIISDRATIKRYWRAGDSQWWQSPDDPNVCALRLKLASGSLWDGPASKTVEAFEFLKAKITGAKPNLGENRKTDLAF